MLVARPTSLSGVFDALDELPGAHLLAGGTDLMVEVNFGHRRPPAVVALRRVEELRGYEVREDEVVLRSGVTWTEVEHDLAEVLPGLAAAAPPPGPAATASAGCPWPRSSPGSRRRRSSPARSSARSASPAWTAPSSSSRSAPATPWSSRSWSAGWPWTGPAAASGSASARWPPGRCGPPRAGGSSPTPSTGDAR